MEVAHTDPQDVNKYFVVPGQCRSEFRKEFPFKSKLCVFCALQLSDEDDHDEYKKIFKNYEMPPIISQRRHTFVHGASILLDILNERDTTAEGNDDTRKLLDVREWSLLLGAENFVSLVCCKKCYNVLANVEYLHRLIVKSQTALKERVENFKNCIIESEKNVQKKDLEYSVKACVEFRQEILDSITQQSEKCEEGHKKNISTSRRRQHNQGGDTVEQEINNGLAPTRKLVLPTAFVKLERLPETFFGKQVAASYNVNTTTEDNTNSDDVADAEHDDYHDMGSPASVEVGPVSSYNNDDTKVMPSGLAKNIHQPKRGKGRKRRRLSKEARLEKKQNLDMKDDDGDLHRTLDEEKDTADKDYEPEEPLTTESENSDMTEDDIDDSLKPSPTVPKRCRKTGKRRGHRILGEEGPKPKPIFVLDSSQGLLMFFSVKFQKSDHSLQCLYPNCQHSEPILGCFSDQLSFHNFRFHVRHKHRKTYKKCVGDHPTSLHYCHICQAQLDSRENLIKHRRALHPNFELPPVLCEVCGKTMPQGSILKHTISHKSEEEKEIASEQRIRRMGSGRRKDITKPLSYPCNKCDKTFKSRLYLRKHHLKHHPELVDTPDPEKTAKYLNPSHRDDFIGPKLLYPCEPCKQQYIYKSMLITHLKGKHKMNLANKEDYPVMWTMEDEHAALTNKKNVPVKQSESLED